MNKGLPIIIVLLLTLLAGGTAFAFNTVLGRFVAPDEEAAEAGAALSNVSPVTAAPTRTRVKSVDDYLGMVINRNLFDSALHGTYGPKTESAGEVRTTLDVVLLGTVVAEPESFSSALIVEKGSEDWPRGYSIGDDVFGHEIVEIEKKRVALRRGEGPIEWLTMDETTPRTVTADRPVPSGGEEGGIEESGENRFAVDRTLFDKYINDIESISRMGRALLHRGPDGEFDGYRLSAIRRNTLADQLGIKNGDVVHSVNGTGLDSVQSAMNAYQTLQNESSFCFEITRRGQPQELCYDVQ